LLPQETNLFLSSFPNGPYRNRMWHTSNSTGSRRGLATAQKYIWVNERMRTDYQIITHVFTCLPSYLLPLSMFPKSRATMETDAHARALLNISFRVPSRGPLPTGPQHWASSVRHAAFLEPPSSISQSPCRWASLQVPHWGPYGNRCPSPEPFLPILQGPQQGSPPSMFPWQSFHRERHPNFRAPLHQEQINQSINPLSMPSPTTGSVFNVLLTVYHCDVIS
jgi:hypothetical protein